MYITRYELEKNLNSLNLKNPYYYQDFYGKLIPCYKKNIKPLLDDFKRAPNKNYLSLDNFFIDKNHFLASVLQLAPFMREENIWKYCFRINNIMFGKSHITFHNQYSHILTQSNFLDNIYFPHNLYISPDTTSNPFAYKELLINKYNAFVGHINTCNQFDKFYQFSNKEKTKYDKITKVLSNKQILCKDLIDIVLYSQYFHLEKAYVIFYMDMLFSLQKMNGIKKDEAEDILNDIFKYYLTVILMVIENSISLSDQLLIIAENKYPDKTKTFEISNYYKYSVPFFSINPISSRSAV